MADNPQNLLVRLSQQQKIVFFCSLGTVVIFFLPWISFGGGVTMNGLKPTEGVLGLVLALATAALVLGPKAGWFELKGDMGARLPMITAAATTLLILYFNVLRSAPGRTVWPWIGMVAMGAATWFAYQGWTAAGGSLDQLKPKPKPKPESKPESKEDGSKE